MDHKVITEQSADAEKSAAQSGTSRQPRSKHSTPTAGKNTPPETWLQVIQEACNNLPAPEYNVVVSGMTVPGETSPVAIIAIYGATVKDGMLVNAGNPGKAEE